MINKFLRLAGYKDKYGRWDKDEIKTDIVVLGLAGITFVVIIWGCQT